MRGGVDRGGRWWGSVWPSLHYVSESEHGDSFPLQLPGGVDATDRLGFGRGYHVFFIARLVPVVVSPVGGCSPGDGRHYGRRERDGKVIGTGCGWGFGFLERRKSG